MKGLHIETCENQDIQKNSSSFLLVISVLFITGFVKIFLSGFFGLKESWWLFGMGCALLSIVLNGLYRRKWKAYIQIAGSICLFIFFILNFTRVKNGIYILVNDILEYLTGKNGKIYLDYQVTENNDVYLAATLFMAFFTLCMVQIIHTGGFVWLGVLAGIGLAGGVCKFWEINDGWFYVLTGSICWLFYKNFRDGQTKQSWKSFLAFAGIFLLCVGFSFGAASIWSRDTADVVKTAKNAIHRLRYDDAYNAMPEGNLINVGNFEKNDKTALLIQAEQPQKFYLRGLVGEVYTGSAWETFDEQIYIENEALFYWLHKKELYGQSMLAKAACLDEETQKKKLTVMNVSACQKHLYLPYALSGRDVLDSKEIGDGTVISDSEEIHISYVPGSIPQWYGTAAYLMEHQKEEEVLAYLKLEQTYRQFVYENDLQMTSAAAGVCSDLFAEADGEKTLTEILEIIRAALDEKLVYNDKVRTLNGKNDFFQYTMEQSKKGYSVHYATAAVLMLRYFGVPARYVEGYYLSGDEAKNYEAGDTIRLTEAHAHAWAEYYLDGIGFIPFEVTPGYVDENDQVIAAQEGENSREKVGKTFQKSTMAYTPPKNPKSNLQPEDYSRRLKFAPENLLVLFGVLLLAGLLILGMWILKRRKRLLEFLRSLEQKDNRTAILEMFGYAKMLTDRCKIAMPDRMDEIWEINLEAMFSNHEMQEEKRRKVEAFMAQSIALCKEKNSSIKNIGYQYVLWLYR
ncbi:MAG: transglutaminase domain-containing protein [Lachnospiraceae bacterium]|nr:transglutaminase domain-containing protein [Lachnospiraceae bacterium]